ncbi:MAG TPA: CorA family divalent cation transporter, partial [Gammaproteobacteria bacterium]
GNITDLILNSNQIYPEVEAGLAENGLTAGMLDVYLLSISNGMNEVMRVLTIIATLFIPPTFIAGIYGMNFDPAAGPLNMPELGWRYGYLFAWGVIALMIGGLLVYFKRKRWF